MKIKELQIPSTHFQNHMTPMFDIRYNRGLFNYKIFTFKNDGANLTRLALWGVMVGGAATSKHFQ